MTPNGTFGSGTKSSECGIYAFLGGNIDQTNSASRRVLVVLIIMSIIASPVTTVLNALVIIAVKTKPRLKTMSNTTLGCLAVTDGLMGMFGFPIFIAARISTVQADTKSEFCTIQDFSRNVIRVLGGATVLHLVLMNIERYIALKHPLHHISLVTNNRVLGFSVLSWFTALVLTTPIALTDDKFYLTLNNSILAFCTLVIFYCQVVVYLETRRHEKHIAAQQVSVEARQKFLKEKKAFKVTTAVLFTLIITYLPIFVIRVLIKNSVIRSKNVTGPVFFTGSFVVIVNSLVNPIIYCVRTRQFRVAFIELLLGKSNAQAEEFETRIFGSKIHKKNNSNNIDNSNNTDNNNESNDNNNHNHNNNNSVTIGNSHNTDNTNSVTIGNSHNADNNNNNNKELHLQKDNSYNSNYSDENRDENNTDNRDNNIDRSANN